MNFRYGVTYHVCPKKEWFASYEKLCGGLVTFGDEHICHSKGIDTIHIKLFRGMIRELKDVRYVPQLNKNLISVGALEVQGLKGALGECILKMSSGPLVVLKGIRHNNLYYVKGDAVTENLDTSK